MARNQDQYTIQINADATRAKKEIADLLKSLKAVGTMNLDKLGLDTQIREASVAADELAIHLKNATNANTGKLNLVEFNKSIQASGRSMNELITTLAQGGNVGQQAFRQLTAAIANTQVPIKQTNALLNNMMTTLKNTVKWELSSAAVHSLESALSGAVSYVEDLNTSLTNIRIVTNKSAEDMAQFAVQANKAAKELSATTKAYTDASLIYFQQGDSEEMAAKKAAITLKAAHSSFNSTASEMSEYLTAVWNSYKVSGDELQRYVDIMAALGANTATSLEEIATSMQKVAATANTVGVSMEQVSSIIATVSSVTRESAESIGTSYKTIFARIGDLKLGKTDEDGIGLGTVSSQLQAIGVDILDQNQNLREMGDIITDLGNRWQTMTSAQKTATAQAVAGKRQYTQLMALFDNWDKYGVNLATAMNSEGTLEQMNSMYEEGLKAAQDRARASMETLYQALLDDKILKQFANATATIADNIANVVKALGGLGGVAKTVGGLLLQAFSTKVGAQIKQIGQGIANFITNGNYKDQYLSIFEDTKNNLARSTKNTDALKQTENMLSLKERLLQIEDSLTNQQAQYAQSAISAYGEQIAKLNEIEQRYISIDNTIKQLSNSMQTFANQNVAVGSNFETHFRNNLDSSNKLQNISMLGRTSLLENTVFNQGSSMKTGLNLLYQLDKMQSIGQTTSSLLSNNIDVTNKGQLQNVLYQLRQIQEITKGTSFENMFSSLNEETLQGAGGLDQFRTQVQNFIQYTESDFNLLSKKITDTIAQIEDPVLRNNLSTLFSSFTNQTQAGAMALEEERAAAEAASNAHDRLSATLEKLNSSFNKFATYGSKVVGAIGALTSSYSMLSNATKNLSLNSNDLIQNIGSITMGISALIPSLMTIASIPGIGPILAVVAGATTVIGSVYSGVKQAEKETYQKDQTDRMTKMKEDTNEKDEELSNIQSLIKNYNSLKETYLTTGEGQDALAASARELADAYGLIGANLLIAEGNFSDFERMIAQSTGLKQVEDFYQSRIDALTSDIYDTSSSSKYRINNANLSEYPYMEESMQRQYFGSETGAGKISEKKAKDYGYTSEQFNLLVDGEYIEAQKKLQEAITTAERNRQNYSDALSDKTKYEDMLSDDGSIKKKFGSFGKTIKTNPNPFTNVARFDDTKINNGIKDIENYFKDIMEIEGANDKIESLKTNWKNLGKLSEDGDRIISNSQITNFINQMEQIRLDLIQNAISSAESTINSLIDDESTGTLKGETELSEAQKALNRARINASISFSEQFSEELRAASGIEDDSDYYDYTTGLLDDEGKLNYDPENKISWYRQVEDNLKKLKKEKEAITNYRLSNNIEAGSAIDSALQEREQDLAIYESILTSFSNEDLSEAIAQLDNWEDAKRRAKIINKSIQEMIGKNEQNTSYNDFDVWVKKLEEDIEATALADQRFKDVIEEDPNAEYGYIVKEGYDEEFRAIRDQIVSGFISDFTSFDDYLSIYKDLSAIFKDDNEFKYAKTYINNKDIKDAREVNSRFLHALQRDIKNNTNEADTVLEYNRQKIKASDIQQSYNTINSLASSYKEKLSLDDAISLQQSLGDLIKDGDDAWSKFIQMDYDGRKAYLEARRDVYLQNIKTQQGEVKRQAKEAQGGFISQIETAFGIKSEDGKIDISKLNSMFDYDKDSEGNISYKFNGEGITEDQYNYMSALLSDYSNNELDIQNADSIIAAIELMTSQTASLTTQISTMAQEFENFNKTGKISANLLRQMTEWGIDSRQIKDAKSYLEVMKQIADKAKAQSGQKKIAYEKELAKSGIENIIKESGWTDDLKTTYADLYALYDEWMQSRITEEETENQYIQARQILWDEEIVKSQKLLEQMRERKQLAEKEASKTREIASAMQGAIESGYLTQEQRVMISDDLLTKWNDAADATERAMIAAQMWNKAAAQTAKANEDIIAQYKDAYSVLDALLDIAGESNFKDFGGFDFGGANGKGKVDFDNFIKQQSNMSEEVKAIWMEAYDEASKTMDFTKMSDIDILYAVKEQIKQTRSLTEQELNTVVASIYDNMANTFETLVQHNVDAAQKAAQVWLDAFNTIKDARQSLLSGESILDQIAGDPKAIYQLMKATGLEANQIYQMAFTNDTKGLLNATNDYLSKDKDSYLNYLLSSYGLSNNFGQNNYFGQDAESLGYKYDKETKRWVGSNGELLSDKTDTSEYNKEVVKKIQDHLIAQYSQVLRNLDDSLSEDQANSLAERIISGDTEAYNSLTESAKAFADAVNTSVKALDTYTEQQEALKAVQYQSNPNNLPQEKLDEISVNGKSAKNYEEYQRLQQAIDRAQQAKYKGESWESLSESDRDILGQFNIDFSNVDTAATECASALEKCAEAAYQLALATATDKGYKQEDGIWKKKDENGEYVKIANPQSDPVIQAIEAIKEIKESASATVEDTGYQTMERIASSVDMTIQEFEDYANTINDTNKLISDMTKEELRLAYVTANAAKGFKELQNISKDTWKYMKKDANRGSVEWSKNITKMKTIMSKIFNTDMKYISNDFVDNHLEQMEKMAKGTKKEALKAQDAIEDDLLKALMKADGTDVAVVVNAETGQAESALTYLQNALDQWDNEEFGFTIKADTAGAEANVIASLQNILSAGQMTADEITRALNAIGWQPQIEYLPVEFQQVESGTTYVYAHDSSGNTVKIAAEQALEHDNQLSIPVIKGASKISSPGGGSRPKSSGGGGGKQKETKKHKRYQDEIERYHKNNETLSRVSEQLDKIEKQKERVYGEKYINRIDEETEALKRQLEAQQALYDEANKYIAADKVDVARYGATFDQDGTIINYEEVMRNIIDEYNRAIDVYNNSDQEEGAKKALEAAEERYNDAVKSIENYEEAIQKANEAENNMLETKNKLSAAEVEKITYKLEFKLEMNERDLALLEYYQDKYAEQLDKQDDLFASYFDTAAEYGQNLNAIGEAYNSLVSKYAAGLITEKDYAEQLEELHDKALDNLKSLNEVEENLIDSYTQALELAQEQVEKTTSSIESANETLQSYMDILNLYEGATDYKKMANFYDMMNKNNITNIEVQKKHLDVLLAEEDKFQEKIRNGQELTELEKKEYEALEEQIQDTRETLLSTTQEALETIRSTYENTINGIADDLDNFMAGSAGSLSYLQEQYEQFQEEQEQYVSTTKELYEVSKLNRDIEGSIADATSKASKEALKALQEKINKQSELNQLTEYDLQMNQLEYQLLLARINLEETKNAKDVVRLTRDDNGNYAYRYTANQDKIDEAAQKYEDVLQQINELTVNRISDTEQKLVNAMANYKEKFVEIATDYTLTEEERLMKLEELTNNFSKNMQYIQEQNQIATDNLATNQEMIADYYGASMSEITSSTAGNVNDNIQSMMNKTQEYVEYMNNAIYGKDGWQTAWKEYIAGLGNIKESSGQAYEDMMDNAQEMGEMNDFSAEQAENVLNVLEDTLEPLTNLTEAWNAHNAILNNTIETYENLAQVIQGTLAAIGQIPNTVGAGDAKTTIDGKAYARGGLVDYTGLAWVDGTPDDPELMLNAGDTQNILAAASVASSLDKGILRTLMESVSTTAQAMLGMLSNAYHAVGISPVSSTTLDQQVHITAEFPNVTDHNEIEEALSTLVNRAAQFANHK